MFASLASAEPVGPDLFRILDLLRRTTAMTRPQLIKQTGLGRRVVTERVEQLLKSGLVNEADVSAPTHRGRPASHVSFNYAAGRVLVAELGAGPSGMSVGIADLAGNLLDAIDVPLSANLGPEIVLGELELHWSRMLDRHRTVEAPLRAIGVGVRGPVDPTEGRTIEVYSEWGWEDYPVRDRLAARFGVPAWAENDVNVIAVGEHWRKNHAAPTDMVFVRVDDGIGAGVISGGRLIRGIGGAAGEIGHIRTTSDPSVICWCGNVGCAVAVASALAIERKCSHLFVDDGRARGTASMPAVIAAAHNGDRVALRALGEAGHALGLAVASIVNLFNPAEIVIGGSVAFAGDLLFAPMRESLTSATYGPARRLLTILDSLTGERLNLEGAAITAVDCLLSSGYSHHWLAADVDPSIALAV